MSYIQKIFLCHIHDIFAIHVDIDINGNIEIFDINVIKLTSRGPMTIINQHLNSSHDVKERVLICCLDDDRDIRSQKGNAVRAQIANYKIDKVVMFIPREDQIRVELLPPTDGTPPGEENIKAYIVSSAIKKQFGVGLNDNELEQLGENTTVDTPNGMTIGRPVEGLLFKEDTDIFDFDSIMRSVNETIFKETRRGSTIYVSIITGSPAYIATSSILAMKNSLYLIGGRSDSIYQLNKASDPYSNRNYTKIEPLNVIGPDLEDLKSLKVYNYNKDPRKRTNSYVISIMIYTGLWNESSVGETILEKRTKGTSLENKPYVPGEKRRASAYEATLYHRNYISRWLKNKWIESVRYSNKYKLTKEIERMVEIFCSDEIFDIDKELKKCTQDYVENPELETYY